MHLLFLSPLLAFDDPGVANSASAFIMLQFVVALWCSRKP
jgi:hypothetical protein